jgi:capsule polysaccharide export protein KpsE/RkpR
LPEGTIYLSCETGTSWFHPEFEEDSCKQTSQDIIGFVLTKIDSLNKFYKSERARYNRIMVEQRFLQNIEDLADAENALVAYQKEYKTIAFEDQVRAAIESYANLKAEYLKNEIAYNVLQRSVPQGDPQLRQKRIELEEMEDKISNIEQNNSEESDYLPGLDNIPGKGLDYIRLTRNVEVQSILYKFMIQQYEEAKLKESKNTPTIQVLDQPNLPEKKYGPPRMKYLFVLGLAYLGTLIIYYYRRVERQYPHE